MEYTSLTPVSKIQINQPSERPLDRPTLVRPQRTSTVLINDGSISAPPNSNNTVAVDPFLMMQRQMSTPTMMDPNMMLQLQVKKKKPQKCRLGSL